MNILVIAHYQGDGSPCAIFIHDQAVEYVKAGHNVLVITPIPLGKTGYIRNNRMFDDKGTIDGVRYMYLRHLSLSRFGTCGFNTRSAIISLSLKAMKEIITFYPDVIQAHTFGFDAEIGIYLKNCIGNCKLVITTHGSDLDVPIRTGNTALIRKEIYQADYVVSVSKKLEIYVKTIVPGAHVITILNGCNTEKCRPGKKIARRIIFVGSLIPQKNVEIVIRSLAILNQDSEYSLEIIGQGELEQKLRDVARELGIQNRVEFLGQLSNEEVIKHMAEAEYFVMPSVHEGFGIVYIEAMACGCITIGTAGEGIDGFIIDGENGLLVFPNEKSIVNAILECEMHKEKKERIIKKAVVDANSLSWKNNASNNIQLFERLIG